MMNVTRAASGVAHMLERRPSSAADDDQGDVWPETSTCRACSRSAVVQKRGNIAIMRLECWHEVGRPNPQLFVQSMPTLSRAQRPLTGFTGPPKSLDMRMWAAGGVVSWARWAVLCASSIDSPSWHLPNRLSCPRSGLAGLCCI